MLADRLSVVALGLLFVSGSGNAEPLQGSSPIVRLSDVERRIFEPRHSHEPGDLFTEPQYRQYREQLPGRYASADQKPQIETGLQLSTEGGRPALAYRLSEDSSLRLRSARRGVRLVFSMQF